MIFRGVDILRTTKYQKYSIQNLVRSSHTTENDVVFQEINNKAIITLNKPNVLNAINESMISKINSQVKMWESSKKTFVLVNSSSDKAFSAGGDLRQLCTLNYDDRMKAYFDTYELYGLISRYRLPFISLIDGFVMGAGAGISLIGQYSVVTEKTVFAMPEVRVGFCPDSGSSHFLSKLPGATGKYLALTGNKLKGSDLVRAGIATHYCESRNLNRLQDELLKCEVKADVVQILDAFNAPHLPQFSLNPDLDKIDRFFSLDTVEEILNKLKGDKSRWAIETLILLSSIAPMSLKVALKLMTLGKSLSLYECLVMEYSVGLNMMNRHDFKQGVKTFLIEKQHNPQWNPKSSADITEDMVSTIFQAIPLEEELRRRYDTFILDQHISQFIN